MTENQIDQDKERDNFIAHVKQLTESLTWAVKSQNPKIKTIYIESFDTGNNVVVNAFDATKSQILNTNINVTGQNREHKFQN